MHRAWLLLLVAHATLQPCGGEFRLTRRKTRKTSEGNVTRFAPRLNTAAGTVAEHESAASDVAVYDGFLDAWQLRDMRELSQWVLRRTVTNEAKHMKRAAEIFPKMRDAQKLRERFGPELLDVQEKVNEVVGLPRNDEAWQIFFVTQDKPWPIIPPFHHDKSGDPARWITVLIYLYDLPPEAGGRTLFPCFPVSDAYDSGLCDSLRAGFNSGERVLRIAASDDGSSDVWNATAAGLIAQQCENPSALAVTPKAARAVVWESAARSTGDPLDYMWHGSCALRPLANTKKNPKRAVVQFFKRWSSNSRDEL